MGEDQKLSTALLLARGYFPKELPPAFHSSSFANFIAQSKSLPPTETTRSAIHNLARPGGQRRRLHLPNPFNYAKLSKLIADNWPKLEEHFTKSTLSVSKPIIDPSGARALKSKREGWELIRDRSRARTAGRFVLRTDISRFYGSIYTHTIPWALDGKAIAKRIRQGGLGNDLDEFVRELQDGQTLGIPTGPDASLVIGEVVATAVDHRLQQAGLTGMRYMDDYELIFPSKMAAEAGYAQLETILWDYELAVNLRKTTIEELPIELERQWTSEIRHYNFENDTADEDQLIAYFNRAFVLKTQNPHDPVLGYAVSRLRNVEIKAWDLLQELISQCALAEHGAMEALVTHFYLRDNKKAGPVLDLVISSTLEEDSALAMGTEVAWALWAAIWFRRRISNKLAKKLDGINDPVVAVLALHARSLGLIKKSVKFPIWGSWMRRSSLSGPEWLLAYEADVKGWLPSAEKPNHVDAHPTFSLLKKAQVSFYNEKVEAPTRLALTAVEPPEPTGFS